MNAVELPNQWPVGSVKPQFRRIAAALHLASASSVKPSRAPVVALVIYVAGALGVAVVALAGAMYLLSGAWWAVILTLLFALVGVAAIFVMLVHVQNTEFDGFKVGCDIGC